MSAFQAEDFEHTDGAGDSLLIAPSNAGVLVRSKFRLDEGYRSVLIPPHKWADLCRAGYRALGHLVPDLPEILDPKLVDELAHDLLPYLATEPPIHTSEVARRLLALGWRKP